MIKILVIGKGSLEQDELLQTVSVSACRTKAFAESISTPDDLAPAIANYDVVLLHWAHDARLAAKGILSLSAAIAAFGRDRIGLLSAGGERRLTRVKDLPYLGHIDDVGALVRLIRRANLNDFLAKPTADRLIAALANVEPTTSHGAAVGILLQVMWGIVVADSEGTPGSEVAREVANCAAVLASIGFDPIPRHLPVASATDRAAVATQFIAAASELSKSKNPTVTAPHLATLSKHVRDDLASPCADAVRRLSLATDEFQDIYRTLAS